MSADRYGRSYWCVKTPLSPSGEIYLHADGLSIRDGCLIFTGRDSAVNMMFAPGQWQVAFAASCIDGHAVAVEHWPGEVAR
jgi:hypothetical protein